jgi:hypothetical protein
VNEGGGRTWSGDERIRPRKVVGRSAVDKV